MAQNQNIPGRLWKIETTHRGVATHSLRTTVLGIQSLASIPAEEVYISKSRFVSCSISIKKSFVAIAIGYNSTIYSAL